MGIYKECAFVCHFLGLEGINCLCVGAIVSLTAACSVGLQLMPDRRFVSLLLQLQDFITP